MRTVLIVDDNVELANLLAVVADAHGFSTLLAHSGQEALSKLGDGTPDAALVDLLLPDMRGHEVVRELTAQGIPCFAMSGVFRGEGLVREAIEVYGAKGFFEKPFVARELMERLAGLLVAEAPAADPSSGSDEIEELRLDDDDDDDGGGAEDEDEVPPLEEMVATTQTTGFFARPERSSEEVGEQHDEPGETTEQPAPSGAAPGASGPLEAEGPAPLETPEPAGSAPGPAAPSGPATPEAAAAASPGASALEPPSPAPRAGPVPAAVARTGGPVDESAVALPFSGRDVWRPAARAHTRAERAAAAFKRTGSLARASLPRLLTALYQGQQTGELRLRRAEVVKVVAVNRGAPVFAASNLGSERFARFAVRKGSLPADKLSYVQAEARRAGMGSGEAMVALGFVGEQQRRELVVRQIKEIIWSAFDWSDGDYQFVLRASPRADLIKLSIPPGPLILEGIRSTYSLVRLRELVRADQRFFPTADPPYQLQELGLGNKEALLLAHTDGSKTVEDLVVLSDLPERDALGLLFGLAQTGILEPRALPAARSRVVLV